MILGVMSDTHGNRKLMHQAAAAMTADFRADIIFHLGDDYADAEELAMAYPNVRAVPGLWCPAYAEGRVPKTRVEEIAGLTVACAHADKDLRARERSTSILLTGHSHEARIETLGHTLYVNPGHLQAPNSRGERASYAIIEIATETVRASIIELTGKARINKAVQRDEL